MKDINQIAAETAESILGNTADDTDKRITADIIKAAIEEALAEQPDGMKSGGVQRMDEQLAAERERSKELSEDCEHYSEVIDKRGQQLAAEREMVRKLGEQYKAEIHLRIDREQQIQTLTDELNRIREVATKTDWNLALRIATVLEKVEKYQKVSK